MVANAGTIRGSPLTHRISAPPFVGCRCVALDGLPEYNYKTSYVVSC